MPVRKIHFFTAVVSLASLLASGFSTAELAEPGSDGHAPNPTPTDLALMRLDDGSALVSAKFPQLEAGTSIEIMVGDQVVVLSDTGDQGDEEPHDGVFTSQVEFDFELFAEANQVLAETGGGRELPLFTPAGRQLIGTRTMLHEGEQLAVVDERVNAEPRRFELPLMADAIESGHAIPLPLLGPSLGLVPSAGAASAPTSIPDSLMIRKLSVVEDPGRTWACKNPGQMPVGNPTGEWTFWDLMGNISNGTSSTSDYIKQLFDHWNNVQTINSHNVAARPNVYDHIIRQWEIRSGGPGAVLLPEHSPFRLLGIVLRVDLRGGGTAYGGGDAGEGRFVFSLHDGNCNSMGKTLILEYKVPIAGCADVRTWAQKWKALDGSLNYNHDLASLTQVFSAAGANPAGPNQSAISQVRTNELLAGSPNWELREFVLPDSGGFLTETTVKQEPDIGHNNSPLLADFINTHWPALVGPPAAQHTVTNLHAGVPFLAGAAPAATLWSVPNALLTVPTTPSPNTPPPATVRDDALFELALNTCSGCHTMETGAPFAHLDYNTPAGQPAFLSGFLTGTSLPDPRQPAVTRSFNDLARRAADLDHVAAMACLAPVNVTLGNALVHQLTAPAVLQAVH